MKITGDDAARAMLAALQTIRLQLHVALAGKEALSIEKQLSIVDTAIIQAEQAGITAEDSAMTDQTKLEPCPFCGKEATRIRPNVHTGLLQIQCDSCWATSVTSTNRAVVIAAWNRRAGKDASGEAALAMLAALKEIATHWANNYDHPHANTEMYRGPYGVGVVDGHRACAIIARAAIAQAEAAGIKEG